MPRTIDYYFTLVSPWAYLGHRVFIDIARKHDARVHYRPLALGAVFPESGGLPLAKRHPLRVNYRHVELQRWRARRSLAMNIKPKFWPFEPTFVDCIVVALQARGDDVEAFLPRAFAAIFEEERDLKDPATVHALLDAGGLDADAVMKAAVDAKTKAIYEADTRRALEVGVFGSPAYVLDHEIFWGQDRLDMLDEALGSGRAPFLSDASAG